MAETRANILQFYCGYAIMGKMKINVVRSRRRTLTLTVVRGEVLVRAPLTVSDAEIGAFVERHKRWIAKRLATRKTLTLENGDHVCLLGKEYAIREGKRCLADGEIFLPAEDREGALRALLQELARTVMQELTERTAQQCGFSYRSVRISSARTRWGSCSREGRIAYTFRCVFLPPEIAEYIVLHELCHTRKPNHSAAFWSEVARYMPDYAQRRKRLRRYEWCMEAL